VALLFEAGKLMHSAVAEPARQPVTPSAEPTSAEPLASTAEQDSTGLDALNLKELRVIATNEGAPYRVSRDAQRQAIIDHRKGSADVED